jgi:hypothetical protein
VWAAKTNAAHMHLSQYVSSHDEAQTRSNTSVFLLRTGYSFLFVQSMILVSCQGF